MCTEGAGGSSLEEENRMLRTLNAHLETQVAASKQDNLGLEAQLEEATVRALRSCQVYIIFFVSPLKL
jgi:hypothetical protein